MTGNEDVLCNWFNVGHLQPCTVTVVANIVLLTFDAFSYSRGLRLKTLVTFPDSQVETRLAQNHNRSNSSSVELSSVADYRRGETLIG